MKYRIVETGEGFIVQERVFFHWRNVKRCLISKNKKGEWCSTVNKFYTPLETLERARRYLGLLKEYPIKYKGHVIKFNLNFGNDFFFYVQDKENLYFFCDNVTDVKNHIDMIEEEKVKESTILKIYDEYGNQKNR